MAKAVGSIEIDIELCKGCDLCVQVCPVDVLEMSTDLNRLGFPLPHPSRRLHRLRDVRPHLPRLLYHRGLSQRPRRRARLMCRYE